MLGYELWESQSGNLMASYESEAAALHAIVERARHHGSGSISSITLVQVDDANDEDEMVMLASGADLLARAVAREQRGRNGLTAENRAPITNRLP